MNLTKLAIYRPILIIVLFTVLGVLGVFSYQQLTYELLPALNTPFVTIATAYPGAAPGEVESGVTRPIEDAVSTVEKIKRVTSFSSDGYSLVQLEFRMTASANEAAQDVQRKINELAGTLPAEVKTPSVGKYDIGQLPIIRAGATAAGLSGRDFTELLMKQIRPRLAQLPGVGQVTIIGGEEREIHLSLRPDALRMYNLTALQVAQVIKGTNLDVPAGTVQNGPNETNLRVLGRFESLDALRRQVITRTTTGSVVRLHQVATVREGTRDARTVSRLNGLASVGLTVQKQTDANAVAVARLVRAELALLETDFATRQLRFTVAADSSEFTLAAAAAVNHDLLLAVVLVATVTLVFLHSLRNALIVMVAIPASLVSTFMAMYAFGFSLNLMTLLAMSLVIGILVDDSIVVLENIHKHLEKGSSPKQAAEAGRTEIGFTALSITLVDVVVFLPISVVPGLVGSLLREFSLVMVVSTLLSLLVSFTVTPMLASRFSRLEHLSSGTLMSEHGPGRLGGWFERGFGRLVNGYEHWLRRALTYRKTVLIASVALFIGSLWLVVGGQIGSEFVAATDRGQLSVVVELPPGTRLQTTDAIAKRLEAQLRTHPDVAGVFTSVGATAEGGGTGESVPNTVEFSVTLRGKEQRTQTSAQVGRAIKTQLLRQPNAKVRVGTIGLFGTVDDSPIIIVMTGTNRDTLHQTARQLLTLVQHVPGTDNVRLSTPATQPETRVALDHDRLSRFGLTTETVGYGLRVAFNGDDEGKFRVGDRDYRLNIRFDSVDRTHPERLARLPFVTPDGRAVQLQQVAQIQTAQSPAKLERRARNNAVVLYAQVTNRPSGDVGADIQAAVANAGLSDQVRISYEGDLELANDGFDALGLALGAAILFVYLIMVALYNSWAYPLVVLFSIPMAVVGALVALWLTGNALSIFSMLGLIMLIGLVTKNAILLVDRTNQNRTNGTASVTEAIIEAGRSRLRPILMTTLAMVIGMLPIALASGAGAEWKTGLAWVLIGGLSSSLLLTLLLIPTIYYDMARLVAWSERKMMPKAGKTVVAGVILVVMLGTSASAQTDTLRLSLDEAIQLGLTQNADVKIARLGELRAQQQVREARGLRLPEVGGGVSYNRFLQVPKFLFPSFAPDPATGIRVDETNFQVIDAGLRNAWNATVQVSVPLINGGVQNGIRQAGAGLRVAEAQTAQARQLLVAEIRKACYQVLIADEARGIAEAAISRAGVSLQETRQLARLGMTTDADTLQAFVQVENLRSDGEKATTGLHSAQTLLSYLIGADYNAPLHLTTRLLLPANGPLALPDFATACAEALANRPDLGTLAAQVEATRLQIDAAVQATRPTLAFAGQYTLSPQANDFNLSRYFWPQQSFVGLTLSVPIYAGGRNEARIQQARIGQQQAETRQGQVRRQVVTDVQGALAQVRDAHRRIENQVRTIGAATRNYDLINSRFRRGLAKRTDLAEADLLLRQAQTNRVQAVYEYLAAQSELERALGK